MKYRLVVNFCRQKSRDILHDEDSRTVVSKDLQILDIESLSNIRIRIDTLASLISGASSQ